MRARIKKRLGDKPLHLRSLLLAAVLASCISVLPLQAADPAKTRELIAVVQSNAPLAERARACQQLTIIGTPDAIPVLAALLSDEKLAHYAREGLEAMPAPAAGEALRAALPKLEGNLLVGVINSLGIRREQAAAPVLTTLAANTSAPVSTAALLALGRIATSEGTGLLLHTLAGASDERRVAAAEALLLAAEQPGARFRGEGPVAAYEAVRKAPVPSALRAAATRGFILARGRDALPLLIEQLRSSDEAMRDIGVRCVRELSPDVLAPARLVAELDRLPVAMHALLIGAIADRPDAGNYVAAIEARTTGGAAEVRLAALKALGKVGRRSSVPVLLRVITSEADGSERDVALFALGRIAAPDADATILQAMTTAAPAIQVRLISVLGERSAHRATPDMIRLAREGDLDVRKAALRTLGIIAKPADLSQLIRLAGTAEDDAIKTLADRAIVTTSMKVLEPERRAEAVLAAFRQAMDAPTKAALLRPLGAIVRTMGGSHEVFFAIRPTLKDESAVVREAALRCLADWPDAAPTTTLLEIAGRNNASDAEREVALRGAIRMATNVAIGRERSPLNVVNAFTAANRAVRTKEEKLMIVSGLGGLRRPEAVAMLQPYLDDPDVRTEAALALVQIAPALAHANNAPALKSLLERIAATDPDEDLRRRAGRLAKGGAPEPTKAKAKGKAKMAPATVSTTGSPVLFNATDLTGWDGDPGIWRVREGVIVGGSLEGNPRNEFLATTRSYRNFVLRLDYKLTGTEGFVNGGVQFRSVRVAQPPNEMSGYQADIGAGHSGSLYDETRRKKFLARAPADQIKRLEKPGDWNRYEIRCDGPRIELSLNGEKTVAFTEEDTSVAREGLIALQIHGNCKAEIRFRNLEIEELP